MQLHILLVWGCLGVHFLNNWFPMLSIAFLNCLSPLFSYFKNLICYVFYLHYPCHYYHSNIFIRCTALIERPVALS